MALRSVEHDCVLEAVDAYCIALGTNLVGRMASVLGPGEALVNTPSRVCSEPAVQEGSPYKALVTKDTVAQSQGKDVK